MEATTKKAPKQIWEVKIQAWNALNSNWVDRMTLTYWEDLYRILPCGINWDARPHRIVINTEWFNQKTINYITELTERY